MATNQGPQGTQPPANMPPMPPSASLPGTVIGSCIIWILYGALSLLGGLVTLRAGFSAYFSLAVGAIFLISGIQVLMGKASGLIGTGVVCIVLAVFQILVGVAFSTGAREFGGGASGVYSIIATVTLVLAAMLMISGILAIVGNTKYKAWVYAKKVQATMARGY